MLYYQLPFDHQNCRFTVTIMPKLTRYMKSFWHNTRRTYTALGWVGSITRSTTQRRDSPDSACEAASHHPRQHPLCWMPLLIYYSRTCFPRHCGICCPWQLLLMLLQWWILMRIVRTIGDARRLMFCLRQWMMAAMCQSLCNDARILWRAAVVDNGKHKIVAAVRQWQWDVKVSNCSGVSWRRLVWNHGIRFILRMSMNILFSLRFPYYCMLTWSEEVAYSVLIVRFYVIFWDGAAWVMEQLITL